MAIEMLIRLEAAADFIAIDRVHRQAFGGGYEAALVRRLRDDGVVASALVAEQDGVAVGHMMLSWLAVRVEGRPLRAVALAPLAVLPERQRQGVGSRLVEAGIEAARREGVAAIIVLGHPRFYPRFGFSAILARGLSAPFSGDSFMALELVPVVLSGKIGSVRYPAAFGIQDGET
jgi:putative acetyltransferase